MNKLSQIGIDAAVAVALVAALVVVFGLDKKKREPHTDGEALAFNVKESEEAPAKPLRLAVTKPQFDDMGRLLRQLGKGFNFEEIPVEALEDPQLASRFDILFATCGAAPPSWMVASGGKGDRPGTVWATWKPEARERVKTGVRNFVGAGKTLYASDWRYSILTAAFPEFIDDTRPEPGAKQDLTAEVVDPGLRERIGPRLPLSFNLDAWYPAAFRDRSAVTYLRGEYRAMNGTVQTTPLLVKIPFQQGTVIYTSFHNEEQNSDQEKQLLQFLVFASVTAQAEAKLTKTMINMGFSPQKQNLLSTSPDHPTATSTYQKRKDGRLLVGLSFNNVGARLRLTVTAPNGRKAEHESTKPFILEIPDAPAGEWKYTVTAVETPNPNFPFNITASEG